MNEALMPPPPQGMGGFRVIGQGPGGERSAARPGRAQIDGGKTLMGPARPTSPAGPTIILHSWGDIRRTKTVSERPVSADSFLAVGFDVENQLFDALSCALQSNSGPNTMNQSGKPDFNIAKIREELDLTNSDAVSDEAIRLRSAIKKRSQGLADLGAAWRKCSFADNGSTDGSVEIAEKKKNSAAPAW